MALLGNLKGSAQVFQDTEFYNGVVSTSGRFDNSSSSYLNRTVAAGNRKTWTLSFWFKRCDIARDQDFLTATGSGATGLWANMITSGDKLQVYGNNQVLLLSNHLLRDTSAWYNIIFRCDTTQSTASNRLKIYLNGSEITSFETDNRANLTQDGDFGISSNVDHHIGANQTPGNYLDGYLAEYNFTDGVSNEPTAFGETKNGVWIPIEYTGSYGTYGFRLKFDGFLGTDTSGNGNNWTPNGFSAEDTSMPDCPENNFATLNPLTAPGGSLEYLEGNLKITRGSVDAYSLAMSTLAVKTGKWYAELRPQGTITSNNHMVGVCITNVKDQSSGDPYLENGQINYVALGNGHVDDGGSINASTFSGSTSFGAGDIVGVALDLDSSTRTVKFYKNNSLVNTSSYGNLSSEFDNEHIAFMSILFGTNTCVWNFGQDSTFAGQISAGGNADGNGIGDFAYSPPSGHLALCSANFDDDNFATIGADSATQAGDHFNTKTYSGNNSTQAITGIGFQPDWVWTKIRSSANNHYLLDSSRGGFYRLNSNNTNQEATSSNAISSFDSDGYTIAGSQNEMNLSGQTYVSWNWKANGGTTSSDSNGSITSTVQANQTAGFSIVLYTGTGANATVGHGLGVAPRWIIMKRRDSAQNWVVYHEEVGNDRELILNATDAQTGSNSVYFNNTSPTSTVFSLGSDAYANASSGTYVAYCFAEVEGYSKFGSYTGNGNADGAFIYTGFRPAWVIFKRTDSTNHWLMLDNKRNVDNPVHKFLLANASDAEDTSNDQDTDFTSNGFKVRNSNARNNASGGTYVYAAFAEASFKFANAR